MQQACVYILQSQKNKKYYIGSTVDLKARLEAHNNGQGGSFTKTHRPWQIVYIKHFSLIKDARIKEKVIKSYKGGNAFKKLINGEVPERSNGAAC